MQPAPHSAVVIDLAAYRRTAPPDDDPPSPSSQGVRPLPRPEFTALDAMDCRTSDTLFAYAS
jgi:hypothetical protein